MSSIRFKIIVILVLLLLPIKFTIAQSTQLDGFETSEGWKFINSDAVDLTLTNGKGIEGQAIQLDYNFTKGTGYGGIQKWFAINLPENYEFTFWIKAESPANNFEIKFIDSSGDNVWWVNNRSYDFPKEWTKIRIKKRHIDFAWGPTENRDLKRVDRIEFTVASFVGGKGTVWIDDLRFEPLKTETESYPLPLINASSFVKEHSTKNIVDGDSETFWLSQGVTDQSLLFDFTMRREFGGLQINWFNNHQAKSFEIFLSNDAANWEKAYSVESNMSNISFIRLPEAEAKYLKIEFIEGNNPKGFGVDEIKFLDIKNSLTLNDFLIYSSKNSAPGSFPRYFSQQASYWTVTGVNNDVKESLINEDGMVEVDKNLFSIEPMIKIADSLYNWHNVEASQFMSFPEDNGELNFTPSVSWQVEDIHFTTGISASDEANVNSKLNIGYFFKNSSNRVKKFEFYLLVRPYQVNPYYQFLNLAGGASKISSINEIEAGRIISVDEKEIISLKKYESFHASDFDNGNIVDLLKSGILSPLKSVTDKKGLANGIIKYSIALEPNGSAKFFVVVPFYKNLATSAQLTNQQVAKGFDEVNKFWETKVNHIRFNLPKSANSIINTYKSNLYYILVNRDKAGIQPGSRSYERSWIRDGSLTSSALLKSGIVEEVKDFIDWYASHQFESGKVPCVVDFRGPDPVPEHDSHGQLIYLIREYFNFTKDTAFLQSKNENVLNAVRYIESLIAQRSTDHYKYGNDSIRAYYGLVPESISHEGYSEKPMHSYWDNFFIMKGLKDAAEIQKILGENEAYNRISMVRDSFRVNLYNSLQLAMKTRGIDYIPGCVELGDFDATSTTIALTPCNESNNLPKPQVYNTFNQYYEFFKNRRDGKKEWVNYTPYEVRAIGSFIFLDQPQRAHELIEYFLADRRPQGWNHWAEVVWNDYRTPRFIGDMPHTWVGSDFINAIRSMFVYENEYNQTLVLAAALYQDWIDVPSGMSIEKLPTYYGDISYSVKKEKNRYSFNIYGDVNLPENGISIKNFNGLKLPSRVTINGIESKQFSEKEIIVKVFPANVEIFY
ncbi:MAG: discoidin domain-containing protein [Bacteroidales bacterium]